MRQTKRTVRAAGAARVMVKGYRRGKSSTMLMVSDRQPRTRTRVTIAWLPRAELRKLHAAIGEILGVDMVNTSDLKVVTLVRAASKLGLSVDLRSRR